MMHYQQQMQKIMRSLLPVRKSALTSSECELLAHLYLKPEQNTPILLSQNSGMKKRGSEPLFEIPFGRNIRFSIRLRFPSAGSGSLFVRIGSAIAIAKNALWPSGAVNPLCPYSKSAISPAKTLSHRKTLIRFSKQQLKDG